MTVLSYSNPRIALAAALVFLAAGCAGLFTEPPKKLYRITPVSSFAPGLPHVPTLLLLDVPEAPTGLDSERIALTRPPLSLDYFADSQWTDRAPIVIQTALLHSFENSGDIVAIDREAAELRADFALRTEIRHFEAEYDAADKPPRIRVTLGARLVDLATQKIVAEQSFARDVLASENDITHVVVAFDQALGGVMQEIVAWTLTTPALRRPPLPQKAP
jgi:cholesterol transport system auxiliary component